MVSDLDQTAPEQSSEDIFSLLAASARRTSDGRLVASVASGMAGTAAIMLLLDRAWWPFALPFVSLAAYGVWGITDRVLLERATRHHVAVAGRVALTGARSLAAVVGALAGIGAVLVICARVLGRWIS